MPTTINTPTKEHLWINRKLSDADRSSVKRALPFFLSNLMKGRKKAPDVREVLPVFIGFVGEKLPKFSKLPEHLRDRKF